MTVRKWHNNAWIKPKDYVKGSQVERAMKGNKGCFCSLLDRKSSSYWNIQIHSSTKKKKKRREKKSKHEAEAEIIDLNTTEIFAVISIFRSRIVTRAPGP